MNTLAYLILVVGTVIVVAMSERPLSSNVVTLALFSFNLAAIIFIAPMVMNFLGRMKDKSDEASNDMMVQLKEIKARLALLAQNQGSTPLPLKNALSGTAQATQMTAEQLKNVPVNTPTMVAAPVMNRPSTQMPQPVAAKPMVQTLPPTARPQMMEPAKPATNSAYNPHQPASFDGIFGNRPTAIPAPRPLAPQVNMNTNSNVNTNSSLQQQMPLFTASVTPLATPAQNNILHQSTPSLATLKETTLVVNTRVGDDDVLCLRGEGPGLNWQEGQPMSYIGNDQWRWSSTEVSQPITCRIYRNDEFSAFGDDIILSPGEKMEVSPSFPAVEA